MKLTTLAALVSCAVLLAGCQTTSGPSAAALSRLETAGFVPVPAFSSLTFGETTIGPLLICRAASCSPPSIVVHLTGPDKSTGLGGTLEEAIRAGRNKQVSVAVRRQLRSEGSFVLQTVRPYVQADQARIRLSGRYTGSAANGNVMIGDALVKGNVVSVTAVVSQKRSVADWFLGVALDRN